MKMKNKKAVLTGLDTPEVDSGCDQDFKSKQQPLRHSHTVKNSVRNSRSPTPLVSLSSASSSNDDHEKEDSISESSVEEASEEPQPESPAVNFS